jgi:hypothetical protein
VKNGGVILRRKWALSAKIDTIDASSLKEWACQEREAARRTEMVYA